MFDIRHDVNVCTPVKGLGIYDWTYLILYISLQIQSKTNRKIGKLTTSLADSVSLVILVIQGRNWYIKGTPNSPPAAPLCVQMDFTRTFEANTKCNNMKYVWSHFYQILVVLKYHRRLWNNIFRCINNHIKGVYLAFFGIFMLLEMFVLFHTRLFRTTKIW